MASWVKEYGNFLTTLKEAKHQATSKRQIL
jgi:hypothetical protein